MKSKQNVRLKSIEINTTQNVAIDYDLATVANRFVATLLDLICVSLAYFILLLIFGGFLGMEGPALHIVSNIPTFLYHLICESIFNGQSPGKMIMKMKVIKINGENATFYDYLIRWIFRLIDITLSVGSLGVISIVSSTRNQRLGDIVAETAVVMYDKKERTQLSQIDTIQKMKLTPKYPDIVKMTEEDMLILKETMDRYRRTPSEGHKAAMVALIKKIHEITGIQPPKKDIPKFLKQLLKEYVLMTR